MAGSFGAVLVEFAPLLPDGPLKHYLAIFLAFAAGVGRRPIGTDYNEIAEAKAEAKIGQAVIASIAPPPMPTIKTSLAPETQRAIKDFIEQNTLKTNRSLDITFEPSASMKPPPTGFQDTYDANGKFVGRRAVDDSGIPIAPETNPPGLHSGGVTDRHE